MQLLDQSVRTLSTVDSDRYHYNYAGLVKTEKTGSCPVLSF